jgi:hypothetical protein
MTNNSSLNAMLSKLGDEVDAELRAELHPADQVLNAVARDILRLERDMTVPGSSSSDSVRIERLMRFIEDRNF